MSANQLDKKDQFSQFWRLRRRCSLARKDWMDLIGDTPTRLLLLDELPPYFDYAIARACWRRHAS